MLPDGYSILHTRWVYINHYRILIMDSRSLPQFKLRFYSHEMKKWLELQAKANRRTINAEINFHLEQIMLKQQKEQSNDTPTN